MYTIEQMKSMKNIKGTMSEPGFNYYNSVSDYEIKEEQNDKKQRGKASIIWGSKEV